MANRYISIQIVRRILQQKKQGLSNRKIATNLQISRNTFNMYVPRISGGGCSLDELQSLTYEHIDPVWVFSSSAHTTRPCNLKLLVDVSVMHPRYLTHWSSPSSKNDSMSYQNIKLTTIARKLKISGEPSLMWPPTNNSKRCK